MHAFIPFFKLPFSVPWVLCCCLIFSAITNPARSFSKVSFPLFYLKHAMLVTAMSYGEEAAEMFFWETYETVVTLHPFLLHGNAGDVYFTKGMCLKDRICFKIQRGAKRNFQKKKLSKKWQLFEIHKHAQSGREKEDFCLAVILYVLQFGVVDPE